MRNELYQEEYEEDQRMKEYQEMVKRQRVKEELLQAKAYQE